MKKQKSTQAFEFDPTVMKKDNDLQGILLKKQQMHLKAKDTHFENEEVRETEKDKLSIDQQIDTHKKEEQIEIIKIIEIEQNLPQRKLIDQIKMDFATERLSFKLSEKNNREEKENEGIQAKRKSKIQEMIKKKIKTRKAEESRISECEDLDKKKRLLVENDIQMIGNKDIQDEMPKPDKIASIERIEDKKDTNIAVELSDIKNDELVESPDIPLKVLLPSQVFLHSSTIFKATQIDLADRYDFITNELPSNKTLELLISKESHNFFSKMYPMYHVYLAVI